LPGEALQIRLESAGAGALRDGSNDETHLGRTDFGQQVFQALALLAVLDSA
jgi:hypothetical protein